MTENSFDKKAVKRFYILFNLFTEGISFFVVVPVVLFYVWSNIQLTPEQLALFNRVWPPFFVFGIVFVLVNNLIVLAPVLRYFKKASRGLDVPEEEYDRARKRFFRLPMIHAVGALFRWLLLLSLPVLVFNILADLTVPQAVNMWLGPPLCSMLGVMSYFTITELYVQSVINRGVFAGKSGADHSSRLSLVRRLTVLSVSAVLLPVFLLFLFIYITMETNNIGTTLLYVRVGIIIGISILFGLFTPILLNLAIRDRMNTVTDFLKRIGGGNLDAAPRELVSHDEFSDVIAEVDDMRKRLGTARDLLIDMNVNLEKKVAERTEELEAAMSELEAMNDNLMRVNRELEDTERIRKKDMALAASIQSDFLPKEPPSCRSYDIAFAYNPWSEVSGDFFDFYGSDGELKGAGIFDVSGHGLSSGLLTLLSKSIISRHFYFQKDRPLSVIIESINNEMIGEFGQIDNFITGILLRFMDDRVEYVNCAHPDIVFRSGVSGRVGMIMAKSGVENKSSFIGVAGVSQTFPSLSLKLGPGDCLLLYTDCMIETAGVSGETFGESGIMEALRTAPKGSARDILDHILRAFGDHRGGAPLKDDLTVIIIQRK
ncbi:MAG: SpoIIE family protein phosphatase [Spirochaetes bacterium]|nr:SpoIIE family protein phosphatase [Spirochaetota bacterium]